MINVQELQARRELKQCNTLYFIENLVLLADDDGMRGIKYDASHFSDQSVDTIIGELTKVGYRVDISRSVHRLRWVELTIAWD